VTASWEGETLRLATWGWGLKPGRLMALQEGGVTRDVYGPILLICCWARGYQAPLSLVSNMDTAEEAGYWYAKRFRIAPFFSDQRRRGFHLHKSRP
jgi:hypothetical protein